MDYENRTILFRYSEVRGEGGGGGEEGQVG